jgi:hypothetical protein
VTAKTPSLIPPGSTNTVVATFRDGTGNSYSASRTFVEGAYAVIPSSFALPSGAVDTNSKGFRIRSYQTSADNQNSLALTEQEPWACSVRIWRISASSMPPGSRTKPV